MMIVVFKDGSQVELGKKTIMPTESNLELEIDTDEDSLTLTNENGDIVFIAHYSDIKYTLEQYWRRAELMFGLARANCQTIRAKPQNIQT